MCSLKQVSEYFEVSHKTIESSINRADISLLVLKGVELRFFKEDFKHKSNCGSLTLFSCEDILRLAFLLTSSDVAINIVTLCMHEYIKVYKKYKPNYSRIKKYEDIFEQCLISTYGDLINYQKQLKCGKYNIDFVINNKIAIEIDEFGHASYNEEEETRREDYIKNAGYELIRFNPHKDILISKVIPEINKLIGEKLCQS